jgi:hypothetical protein
VKLTWRGNAVWLLDGLQERPRAGDDHGCPHVSLSQPPRALRGYLSFALVVLLKQRQCAISLAWHQVSVDAGDRARFVAHPACDVGQGNASGQES